MTLKDLQKSIKYTFSDESMLAQALTHSSWSNEHDNTEEHNERLEFLGDAVLEISVSAQLYARFPDAREGDLTRLRSGLVNTEMLARIARRLNLGILLRMSRGEEHQGGRQRDALLADALEAVFGAVFVDGGVVCACGVVERLYMDLWPASAVRERRKDFKTRLQEATQRLPQKGLPVYTLEDSTGPEHARSFSVRVDFPDGRSFRASAHGLKRAEQEAARVALEALGEE